MKLTDRTRQRYGSLTVLERAPNNADGKARWRCTCDCGKETVVYGYNLQRGQTKSCGHLNAVIDRTRQRYGSLTVLERASNTASGHTRWRCLCDCSNVTVVEGGDLQSGDTKSCGCGQRPRGCGQRPRQAIPSYTDAHKWLKTDRGRAKDYACVGCSGSALHWSYDHTDPAPLYSPEGFPYSTDQTKYQPRCKSCRVAFDASQRELTSSVEHGTVRP